MKIGIIGLGNIAQKAYLPVISGMNDVELVLCTRNPETLNRVSAMYRIPQCVQTVDELIERGINAAFVHSATEAHAEITEKLLNNDIDVYVDKPIAYSYDDALKLVQLTCGHYQGFLPCFSVLIQCQAHFAPLISCT